MVDRVDEMLADGGPHGLGLIRGSSRSIPSAWFFAAHFMNDPVWPGSLGLESLLQLLKLMAVSRWGAGQRCAFESPVLGQTHRWTYRGQIVPTDHRVTVQAEIKACDDGLRRLLPTGTSKSTERSSIRCTTSQSGSRTVRLVTIRYRRVGPGPEFLTCERPSPLRRSAKPVPGSRRSLVASLASSESMKYSKVYIDAIGYEIAPVVVSSLELERRLEGLVFGPASRRGPARGLDGNQRAAMVGGRLSDLGRGDRRGAASPEPRRASRRTSSTF